MDAERMRGGQIAPVAETGGDASALVLSAAAVVAAVPVSACRTGAAQAAASHIQVGSSRRKPARSSTSKTSSVPRFARCAIRSRRPLSGCQRYAMRAKLKR